MSKEWSEKEVGILIDNFNETRAKIAEVLDEAGFSRTVKAVERKIDKVRENGAAPMVTSGDPEEEPVLVAPEYIQGSKKEVYAKYKAMMQDLIVEAKAANPAMNAPALVAPMVGNDFESLVVVLSDLHVGKTITNCDGEQIYNIPISVDRIHQIGDSILRVISHAQKGANIDEIVVCMVGDMCEGSGDIYKTQSHSLDDHVAGQVKAATRSLWSLIVKLSNIDGIKKVRVVTCRGNHGRMSDFAHEDSNIDNLLYDNLQFASILHGDTKISVETKYSAFHAFEIRGHRILLRHEAPITCDTPAARAKLAGWFSMHSAKMLVSGHFHHTQISTFEDKYVIRNASLCGPDNLSEKMGVFAKCEQTVFGVSQKRIPTYIYPVTLE